MCSVKKAQEKGLKGDIEMFGVSPKEFKKEADKGNIIHEGGDEYSITDGYLWLTWGALNAYALLESIGVPFDDSGEPVGIWD